MKNITNIETIYEFTNDGNTCGVYVLLFKRNQKIFIRNGNSVGVVCHYVGSLASKCVSEIRDDIKEEFFALLEMNVK